MNLVYEGESVGELFLEITYVNKTEYHNKPSGITPTSPQVIHSNQLPSPPQAPQFTIVPTFPDPSPSPYPTPSPMPSYPSMDLDPHNPQIVPSTSSSMFIPQPTPAIPEQVYHPSFIPPRKPIQYH